MALGARVLTGADLAVSVTGLAGPDGDDRGNPVGTVFTALAAPEGVFVEQLAWAATGRRYAPCPPIMRWIWRAAISPIK